MHKTILNINRAILNPWFFISFIGTLVLLPLCTWLLHRAGLTESFYYALAATIIYVVGAFGVTIFGNVPLNEALDKFDIGAASISALKAQRIRFEIPWNRLHMVRTLATIASLALSLVSIFKQ